MQVGTKIRWNTSRGEVYVISKIVLDARTSRDDLIDIDSPKLPSPVTYYRHQLDHLIGNGHAAIVSDEAPVATTQPAEDCPECWGTGYFKGYGAVCSKGCRAKVTN